MLGLDFATTGVKMVRVRRAKGALAVVGVNMLPPFDLTAKGETISIPREMRTNYVALGATFERSVFRVVYLPLAAEDTADNLQPKLREQLSVGEDFRASFQVLSKGGAKQDSALLAVAVPETDAKALLAQFAAGAPAPYSMEVAGIATLNAFLSTREHSLSDQAVCLIESGARVTTMTFLERGKMVLTGKFNVGGDTLKSIIQTQLGVDADMARTIMSGGSIDISSSVKEVMTAFLRQLSISRDFVERQKKCRVAQLFLSGGMSQSPYWVQAIQETLGMNGTVWDPFEGMEVAPEAIPDAFASQRHRFAAALGVVVGAFDSGRE